MRIDNPDELPYYVMEDARPVRVRFTPLEAGDDDYINDWWSDSIYFPLWQHLSQNELTRQTTLKLVAYEEVGNSILGLLLMGSNTSTHVTYGKLNTQSVLETAPHLRYDVRQRSYRGVGKVLVARLIARSILQGYGGGLVVSPRPQVFPFYRHLGFQPLSREPNRFFIRQIPGSRLLQSVLAGSEGE